MNDYDEAEKQAREAAQRVLDSAPAALEAIAQARAKLEEDDRRRRIAFLVLLIGFGLVLIVGIAGTLLL